MRKTSVYLTEDEAEQLRRASIREGKPQAELIREGIRRVLTETVEQRRFRSLGMGHGGGRPYTGWDSDELFRRRIGEE